MNRLESTVNAIHEGLTINALSDNWNRTAKVLVAEIDRLRDELAECRAAPPVPAAIVLTTTRNGLCTHRLVLFADKKAAVEFYLNETTAKEIFIHPDPEIVWHPDATPDAAEKPIS